MMLGKVFARMTIARKIAAAVATLIVVVVFALAGFVIPAVRDALYKQKRMAVQNTVDTVYALVAHYASAADQGRR